MKASLAFIAGGIVSLTTAALIYYFVRDTGFPVRELGNRIELPPAKEVRGMLVTIYGGLAEDSLDPRRTFIVPREHVAPILDVLRGGREYEQIEGTFLCHPQMGEFAINTNRETILLGWFAAIDGAGVGMTESGKNRIFHGINAARLERALHNALIATLKPKSE